MRLSVLAGLLMIFFAAFSGGFAWLAWRVATRPAAEPVEMAAVRPGEPAMVLDEAIGDGRIEAEVYLEGSLSYRIEVRVSAAGGAATPPGTPPTLVLAMADMRMNRMTPPLEAVGPDAWRASGSFPMAGRWALVAGYGGDLVERTLNVR